MRRLVVAGTPSTFGILGAVSAALFTVAGVVMHVVRSDLDPLTRLGSEYALGRMGWLFVAAMIVLAAGAMALALALRSALGSGGWAQLAVRTMLVAAAGLAGTGAFPTDPIGADGEPIETGIGTVHNVASFIAFAGVTVGAYAVSRAWPERDHSHRFGSRARTFAWLLVIALPATVLADVWELAPGLVQRLFVAVVLAWMAALAMALTRASPPV